MPKSIRVIPKKRRGRPKTTGKGTLIGVPNFTVQKATISLFGTGAPGSNGVLENVFGQNTIAVEAEGEHAAQGGAIAHSVCGKRVVNYTSGQGVVYGVEQYYHAPGKGSTMVLEVGARALTKHALNVHCGHDDIYGALDTGWIMIFGKDAQQAADQSLILRRVTELSLTPGVNIMDGFLTSHLERTFYKHESELIREYLGAPDDIIDCPTEAPTMSR